MILSSEEIEKRVADSYELPNEVLKEVPEPMVSIRTSTYNHGPYIKQCIEGVLMQKTSFPFEYIIGEDFSTDETREIVFEYAKKYPQIIRVVTADYNVGSKANGQRCIRRSRGKYMAICEGDDYWTDPLKLQKQVDFLESHLDYSMCFHNAQLVIESSHLFNLTPIENRDYAMSELFEKWLVPTASILVRRELMKNLILDSRLLNGDIYIVLSASSSGKVYGMSDFMSVYRVQDNGLTIKRAKEDNVQLQKRYIEHYHFLKQTFPEIPTFLYRYKLSNTYVNLGVIYVKINWIKSICYISKALVYSPKCFWDRLLILIHKII